MTIRGNFFSEKKEWSKLKDQILDHYLTPYLSKITTSGRPTRIADCFAGKGRFDDGQPGSPIIITRHVQRLLERQPRPDVKAIFIEQKYADTLKTNLAGCSGCEVIEGDYENCLHYFLSSRVDRNRNYFFYVDPYGIKNLDFALFARLKSLGFRSLEMLINLNTTGFLREGCRLLNLTRAIPDWAKDIEYETDQRNTPTRMDEVAGGNYWQGVLGAFQDRTLDFHQAEEQFIAEYTALMGTHFKYVIHIPIKERSHHMPKYRLVFATDHHDGLFLMADEMNGAWRKLLEHEQGGQLYLFDDDALGSLAGLTVEEKILAEIVAPINLRELLIRLIRQNGIAHTTAEYRASIKKAEGTLFRLIRDPDRTPGGRPSRSMDFNKARITVAPIIQ